ncbi:UNVERIFIED_CONTAM: hypothetical protein HDU68_009180 [Siphonaria sp. JEL0065]|nr:hypothetical protein HDU68_009180 [Siphonaria sp. JEL0065]
MPPQPCASTVAIYSHSHLDSIPMEVLDQIVPFLDAKSLITLCHTLTRLKYISHAIYKVGSTFNMGLEYLWPDFWFPVKLRETKTIPKKKLPTCHPIKLSRHQNRDIALLTRLVSLYGGTIKVQAHSIEYLDSIRRLLPKTIDLYCGVGQYSLYSKYEGTDSFESILVKLSKRNVLIRKVDVPYRVGGDETESYLDLPECKASLQSITSMRCLFLGGYNRFLKNQLLDFQQLMQVEVDGDDDYRIPGETFDDFLDIAAKHGSLKRVVFESIEKLRENYDSPFIANARNLKEGLEKIGWTCSDGVGDIYGNACVIWEKQRAIF